MNVNAALPGGLCTSLVTPLKMDHAGRELTARMVDRHISTGASSFLINGSMGEFTSLALPERVEILDAVVCAVGDRVAVVAGVSDIDVGMAVKTAVASEKAGAAAVMLAPLSYWPISDDEIVRLYSVVSDAVSIPIVAYNTPHKTSGNDLHPELLLRLAETSRVAYLKESSHLHMRLQEVISACGDRIRIFTGLDTAALEGQVLGSHGWMAGISNLLPRECAAVLQYAAAGRLEDAMESQARIFTLVRAMSTLGRHPVSSTRAALTMLGYQVGPPRRPLEPLSEAGHARLRGILLDAGLEVPAEAVAGRG